MKWCLRFVPFLALPLLSAFGGEAAAPVAVTEGTCGVYSPDGSAIAFQRSVGGKSRVAVMPRAGGEPEWLETEGNAAHPAWNRAGDAVVYAYGNETKTAIAAQGGDTGYHLRVWRRGAGSREITKGRFRDSMPSFSPDGQSLIFASTRCTRGRESEQDVRTALYVVPVAGGEPACVVTNVTSDSGVGQPVYSPDGRFVAYAWIPQFLSSWSIVCARADDWRQVRLMTPAMQYAYAPRWSPDGRYLFYTGFAKGDPCWGVYALDVLSGQSRRICDGRNPDVHPSGKSLLYDDGKRLLERPLSAADLPSAEAAANSLASEPERVIWSATSPTCPLTVPMDKAFAFGDGTFFLRVKVRFEPASEPRFRYFLAGNYDDTPPGYQMCFEFLLDRGVPQFGMRHASGSYEGVDWPCALEKGRVYTITGIRSAEGIGISLDGGQPVLRRMSSYMPLLAPGTLAVGHTYAVEGGILSAEIGTGWPANVPHPQTGRTFFADGKEASK